MKVAYLAPEIPALSATFVYNEILSLEKMGFEILPISVHVPQATAQEDDVRGLVEKTHYLYRESLWVLALANLSSMSRRPGKYLGTLFLAISDALKVGVTGHVGRGLLYRFLVGSRVASLLTKNRCRHLHTHFAHVPTDIAMYASRLSGVPFSFTSHANDLFERGWLLKEKVERAKVAVTISEYNRRFFVKQRIPENKIKIVRCGVQSRDYESGLKKKEKNEVPVIGTLGRLVEKKGIDVLIMALSELRKEGFDFVLEIVGDGPLMAELKALTSEQGLGSEVVFMGAMAHDRVFEWFQGLDTFVLACKKDKNGDQDGIPVVLMEAMALGVPVISTHISGIPELIKDGVSGLLAQPNDTASLTDKIRAILENPSRIDPMTIAAKKRIREEFDVQVNTKRLIRLFEE